MSLYLTAAQALQAVRHMADCWNQFAAELCQGPAGAHAAEVNGLRSKQQLLLREGLFACALGRRAWAILLLELPHQDGFVVGRLQLHLSKELMCNR